MEDDFLLGLIFAFLAFFVVLLFVGLILFIFQAIGLFKMAKREGKGDIAWLAWIPVVSQFLVTLLVERNVHPGLRGKFTLLYGIAVVLSFILGYFIAFISLIPFAMYLYAFYFIAKKYSDNPTLHIVIAIITIGFSIPIQIFIFRNREVIDTDEFIIDANEN